MLFITLLLTLPNNISTFILNWLENKKRGNWFYMDKVNIGFSPFALSPGSLKLSTRNAQFEQFRFEILDSLFRFRRCQLKVKRMGCQS